MMKTTQPTTTLRHAATALPWVLLLLFAPAYALAGGVVEELRPMSQSMLSATSSQGARDHRRAKCSDGVKEAPMSATATASKKYTPELISLVYDPIQKHTVLRWKPFVHEGQKAIQYHIYRWSLSHPTRQLIAKVDGNTLEFVDTNKTVLGEVYFYDIVGIYHIDGKYQVWQYPSKRIMPQPQQVETDDAPPQAGIGCSSLQGQPIPNGGWLWLLALPFLAFIRQRRP